MDAKALNTIDGETLMSTPLAPVRFVVDGLIAPGLNLLAGAAKVGKSWLALWLALSVAKGEDIWNLKARQGTTLYLCLEDSTIRIQNRLFEITEDAPPCVHFTTEASTIGHGLEAQIENFIVEHPGTVLIIIDTLQMVRAVHNETNYACDYRELSALKKVADKYCVAILLIHHLRKENDADTFNRISGTTALQGAVDSSFTMVEDRRGSGRALLSCIGRDIEYREIEIKRNGENVWEMVSDSYEQPGVLKDSIISLLSDFMKDKTELIGTPTEVAARINADSDDNVSARSLSKRLLQGGDDLAEAGISFEIRRSNGKRLITLRRLSDDSDVITGCLTTPPTNDPVDPAPENAARGAVSPCVPFSGDGWGCTTIPALERDVRRRRADLCGETAESRIAQKGNCHEV